MQKIISDFRDLLPGRITKERALALVVTFFAVLLTAQLSKYWYTDIGTYPYLIWVPTGISLAAVILDGYGMLLAIFLAAVTGTFFLNGLPLLIAVFSVVGTTLQPALSRLFLEKAHFDRRLVFVKDMFLMLIAGIAGTAIWPTFLTLGIVLNNRFSGTHIPLSWEAWWIGSTLSVLALTPFLIRWIYLPMHVRTRGHMAEAVAFSAASFALLVLVFLTPYTTVGGFSLFYIFLLVLMWGAFRVGPRFMTLTLFVLTAISIFSVIYGPHPATQATVPLSLRLFNMEVLDIFIILIFFMLVSVEEQRKSGVKVLQRNSDALALALENLKREETSKNAFIATLAHELRNPLATLLSSTELMALDASPSSEAAEQIHIMHTRIQTMGRLLDDLLDVTRMARNELTLHRRSSELKPIVRSAFETVGHALQKKHQTFSISLPHVRTYLDADPIRIEQIFVNLLYNAIKYTPEKGHIDFTARFLDRKVIVSIADTGVGIPPSMLSRIFEPFVQAVTLSPIDTTEGLGTGLGIGLSLAKQIALKHGGDIEARANPSGTGSEFLITLPATQKGTVHSEEHPVPTKVSGGRSGELSILLVEDNETTAENVGRLLTKKGYAISVVTTGKEAIMLAPTVDPDVVLLDLGLPDLSGYEVAKAIRAWSKKPVLVALTGYGQREDKEKTAEAGFRYHLTKPVAIADLEAVFRKIHEPVQPDLSLEFRSA